MSAGSRRARQLFYVGNGVAALAVSAFLLVLLGAGLGQIPALGRVLVPGHGVWASGPGGRLPAGQTLLLAGLSQPVLVTFTVHGLASISARTDADAYTALGYVHAEFRLAQMDLDRRVAEGRLAQLIGPSGVASDEFELRLGLLRTARQEWAQLPKSGAAAAALVAYSRGVDDYLAQARASGRWPAEFSLAGVYPADWTPVDSLAVQGVLTQELGFSTTPLDYVVLDRSLGAARTLRWLPPAGATGTAAAAPPAAEFPAAEFPAGVGRAAAAILAEGRALSGALGTAPAAQLGSAAASTAWAANGPKVAGGGSLLAGDPDLPQTLPPAWYQVALTAPGLAVSGVTVPGLPAVIIGHNAHIAWSLAQTPAEQTLYYDEQTSRARPGRYFWRGHWRRPHVLHYVIPVRGAAPRPFSVAETAHGPVLTRAGRVISVDWTGALGSPDLAALLAVDAASDFAGFSAALAAWRSPDLTFVYADDHGHIGEVAAGSYQQPRQGEPWLPLAGSGSDDVAALVPAVSGSPGYDPPAHVITAGGAGAWGDVVPGYLARHAAMGMASFAALQHDPADPLAGVIVPKLLAALRGAALNPVERAAERELAGWHGQMTASSPAAAIWWLFWSSYLTAVFQPWWNAGHVPVRLDPPGLSVSADRLSLDADLAAWTVGDQRNAAFRAPGTANAAGPVPPAVTDMRAAFELAVNQLDGWIGGDVTAWQFGKLHTLQFPALTRATALGYGPAPGGGDQWTVSPAVGFLNSQLGQSVRVVAGWPGGAGPPVAEVSMPGGQSENPVSPWYADLAGDWWAGRYVPLPLPSASASASPSPEAGQGGGVVTWELRP